VCRHPHEGATSGWAPNGSEMYDRVLYDRMTNGQNRQIHVIHRDERTTGSEGPEPNALSLELANTIATGRSGATTDLLRGPAELRAWLDARREQFGDADDDVLLRLAEFRALRDSARELFLAASGGVPLPRTPAERINALSAAVPRHLALDLTGPGAPVAADEASPSSRTAEIMSSIARSAIDLLGGEARARVRCCPAPRCGRFFVASRPRQVWCSAACGNRARVARHQARVRGSDTSRGRPA